MISYIIDILIFQAIFFMAYELMFKNDTFFNLKRLYLVVTPLLSLAIPFIKLDILPRSTINTSSITLPTIFLDNTFSITISQSIEQITFPLVKVLWITGAVLALLAFLFKIMKLVKILKTSNISRTSNYIIINIPKSTAAFSWFNMMFLGQDITTTMRKTIIAHESVHIKQKHSFDLLIFEVLKILMWFNPFVYGFKNRLITVHEFIADNKVVTTTSKNTYYQTLLSEIFQTEKFSFTNTFFNQSLTKKRIVMLHKLKSKPSLKLKYALVLPLLSVMLIYTSCKGESKAEDNTVTTHTEIEKVAKKDMPIAYSKAETLPKYKDCNGTRDEISKCTAMKISQHVVQNFNDKLGSELELDGNQRIVVSFIINKDGNPESVSASAKYDALENEAVRVIKTLPQMMPGEHDGKPVKVNYTLPIVFEIKS